jgi:hypothetical protein
MFLTKVLFYVNKITNICYLIIKAITIIRRKWNVSILK